MLGPNDDINKRSQHARRVEEYEAPASSIEEAAVPVRPRQSKRPKRKRNDDVTFLDKFAFGSKQEDENESATCEKSESESDEDEAETSSSIRPASRNNVSISSTNTRGNLVGRGRATSGARVLV